MKISKFTKLLLIFLTSLLICVTTPGIFFHAEASREKKHMALAWHKQSNAEKLVKTEWIFHRGDNKYNYQKIKEQLDKQPEGYRTLFSWNLHKSLFKSKKDYIQADNGEMVRSIWHENGFKETKERFDNFFRNLKKTGAQLDYFVLDSEIQNYYYGQFPEKTRRLAMEAIAKDPRFKSEGWDKKLGMNNLEALIQGDSAARNKFNSVIKASGGELIEKAIFDPIRKYYPNVILGNYLYVNTKSQKNIGNRSVPVAYGYVTDQYKKRGLNSPFGSMMITINSVRNQYIYDPSVGITPWVAWHGFRGDSLRPNTVKMANTDFYNEAIFHMALTGVKTFLFWNPRLGGHGLGLKPGRKKEDWTMPQDEELMNNLLVQLDEIVGYKDTVPIVDKRKGEGDFILTGMKIPHKNISIYRFTPKLENKRTLESTIVKNNPLTFQTATKTIVFKKGKILTPKRVLSKQGYWIKTSEEDKPIIKNKNQQKNIKWWKNLKLWK